MSGANKLTALAKTIKIITVPAGEPPRWVRRCWVGCVFPCLPEIGNRPVPVFGVETGEAGFVAGFSVKQNEALRTLEKSFPTATAWWCHKGFPQDDQLFRFRREECEVLEYLSQDEWLALPGKVKVWDDLDRMCMP